jgi:hypothetical protein
MDKIRFIKRETTFWNRNNVCENNVYYKLQYQKNILGLDFWKDFKEMLCGGMGDCYSNVVWEKDKQVLLDRFICKRTKDKYTIEYEK